MTAKKSTKSRTPTRRKITYIDVSDMTLKEAKTALKEAKAALECARVQCERNPKGSTHYNGDGCTCDPHGGESGEDALDGICANCGEHDHETSGCPKDVS